MYQELHPQAVLAEAVARPGLQILPTMQYTHPRRAVMRDRDQNHWTFSCSGIEGASLLDAYEGQLLDLDRHNNELFPANFGKVSFHIAVRGDLHTSEYPFSKADEYIRRSDSRTRDVPSRQERAADPQRHLHLHVATEGSGICCRNHGRVPETGEPRSWIDSGVH